MLCLGMGLFATASIMSNGVFEELGYRIATILTAVGLVIPATFFLVALRGPRKDRRGFTYLLFATFSMVCWLMFWRIQSTPTDIPLVLFLAGVQGVLWSLGYVKTAFGLRTHPRKASFLCVTAATTSFVGIVVATQPALSRLNAVTAAASYTLFVGLEIVLTARYLYRQIASLAEAELQPVVVRHEVGSVYASRVLIDEESLFS